MTGRPSSARQPMESPSRVPVRAALPQRPRSVHPAKDVTGSARLIDAVPAAACASVAKEQRWLPFSPSGSPRLDDHHDARTDRPICSSWASTPAPCTSAGNSPAASSSGPSLSTTNPPSSGTARRRPATHRPMPSERWMARGLGHGHARERQRQLGPGRGRPGPAPLRIPAERTYFTDCLPYYFVKTSPGSQGAPHRPRVPALRHRTRPATGQPPPSTSDP